MPNLSRRQFFAGLSGFAAATYLDTFSAWQATTATATRAEPPVRVTDAPPRASIVACGGGGCNVLARIAPRMVHNIELFAIDAHEKHPGPVGNFQAKFASCRVRTFTVSRPEIETLPYLGSHALDELAWPHNELEPLIAKLTETGRPVVVLTCLGGQTGSLTANAVAPACRDAGLAVQAVASTPFNFEAERRARIALTNLTRLARHSDVMRILPNRLSGRGSRKSPKLGAALSCTNALLACYVTTSLVLSDQYLSA